MLTVIAKSNNDIKAVFFDLDRTLWDFEKNADETLADIFHDFNFDKFTKFSSDDFVKIFHKYSNRMWQDYEKKLIDKQTLREKRFVLAMDEMEIENEHRPDSMWQYFLEKCPQKTNMMPGAIDILEKFHEKYNLSVITNGFVETQRRKIQFAGLDKYFSNILISDEVGYRKPDAEIFLMAVNAAGVKPENCIMIGDSLEMDVYGAINCGMDAVYFNNDDKNFENKRNIKRIFKLSELEQII